MKAYDQYLKVGIAIFCALCLPANTLACEADNADFSTLEYLYLPMLLGLEIKEGNDELVDQLRSAADQGTVEIGNPSWDELSAELGIIKIEAHWGFKRDSEGAMTEMWFFSLTFPSEMDPDSIAERYRSLPYIADVDTYGSWESWESSNTGTMEPIIIEAGIIIIKIKEGNDALVDQLFLASDHYTVEIDDIAWNDLGAELGLRKIEALGRRSTASRSFALKFPLKSDLNELAERYCSLPYVENVFLDRYAIIPGEPPSAITEMSWGLVKHRGLDLRRTQVGD